MVATLIFSSLSEFYLSKFPRIFAVITGKVLTERSTVFTLHELLDKFWDLNGYSNVYAGVYSEHEILNKTIDRLYFDFDSEHNPTLVRTEAKKFYTYIIDNYGGRPFLLESGAKGYNVYIEFKPVTLQHFSKSVRDFVDPIVKELKLKTLDYAPLGDIRRFSRIPFSVNTKSGRICRPIRFDNGDNVDVALEANCSSISDRLEALNLEAIEYYSQQKVVVQRSLKVTETKQSELTLILEILARLPNVSGSGWNRAMWCLVTPRLAEMYEYSEAESVLILYLADTGNMAYKEYCVQKLRSAYEKESIPWGIDTFLKKYPDTAKFWSMR